MHFDLLSQKKLSLVFQWLHFVFNQACGFKFESKIEKIRKNFGSKFESKYLKKFE